MRYEFGPFRLDTERLVLLRDGEPVSITPKALQTLRVLVENAGRLVGKDELLTSVWDDMRVEEGNLTQTIFALRRILGEKPRDHRFIVTVPGKGYRFVAELRPWRPPLARDELPSVSKATPEGTPSRLLPQSRFVLFVLLLGIGATILPLQRKQDSSTGFPAVPLTSNFGSAVCPTFGPDGQRVAFAWDGESQDNFDIYIKQIGVAQPLRLTSGPEADISPAWSPDGRTIAFLHVIADGKAEVLLTPASAPAPARKLTTVAVPPRSYFHLKFMTWSPDGKWLTLSDSPNAGGLMSLILLSATTGECRRLTFPPAGYDDFSPAFSPDMRRLAFVRYSSIGATAGDLYVLNVSSDLRDFGEPERLTFYNRQIVSPAWTPDSRALLFVRHEEAGRPSLWRMTLGRKRRLEPLPIPTDTSFTVALSPGGNRLVYTRESQDVNIWAIDLKRDHRPKRTRQHIASTWTEENPQFSPDGRRIAYQSSRSGGMEIWVCDRDGSQPRQLTQLGAVVSGFARWSPDGQTIAFHSRPNSLASLYKINADGGEPERLTLELGNNIAPSWSHDGKWIYFVSRRTGQSRIWKMPSAGGAATQITSRSGWCPLESKDGHTLYYASMSGAALWSLPLSGGRPEREVLTDLAGEGSSYVPATNGVYFIRSLGIRQKHELAFFDPVSNRTTRITEIEKPVSLGLTLSPQEDMILYSQVDRRMSDLMLVDNFH